MDNIEVSKILEETADILEIKGENQFRVGAYRKASQVIGTLSKDINEIYRQNKLEEIPGIGKNIASHIKELLENGKCREFESLKKQVPSSLIELLKIEGLGPKKVKFLFEKFNVKSVSQLEKLLKSHYLENIPNWGEKSVENILKSLKLYKKYKKRFILGEIYPLAQDILFKLKKQKYIDQAEICGSIRRMKETIGDLDFLVASKKPGKAIDFFCRMNEVGRIIAKGETKVNVVLKRNIDADLRVVNPQSFGAALCYFTGSKAHNIVLRRLAMKKGLKINEYGVFKKNDKNLIKKAGEKEEDIYRLLGLSYIPPELRENRGEIEVAQKNQLPTLIKSSEIKGDLHLHTNWSDGDNSIEEIVEACRSKGYKYIAITDHASNIGVANGLSPERVLKQIKEIRRLDKKFKNIKILAGIEVDIQKDGSLVLPNSVLEKLDFVIASIHSSFHLSREEMTKRLLKAMENPYINVIGHLTGRLINKREPYNLDLGAIFKQAQKNKIALEINAFFNRLDLNDINARQAKDMGVKIVISTDAHNISHLSMMDYGISQARRAWLGRKDVLNTQNLNAFLASISRPFRI